MRVPAKEGMAQLPGTHLGYWDTGGAGQAIVLLHVPARSSPASYELDFASATWSRPLPSLVASMVRLLQAPLGPGSTSRK